MTFLWSDAWIFQAIALASKTGAATLAQVFGAADGVNHALPTNDELHGALLRLTGGGPVEETDGRFRLTGQVPNHVVAAIVAGGWEGGRDAPSKFLGAEPWSEEKNSRDPRNRVEYPGLTDERIRAADQEYRRCLRA
jgi:hypothetical protein